MAMATSAYALVKMAHQPGRSSSWARAISRAATLMGRCTGTVGILWAKCTRSPTSRRGNDRGTDRPRLSFTTRVLSILDVQADAGNGDGAAIAIIRGVVDPLEVEGDVNPLTQLPIVICLKNLLGAVVEPAIADYKAQSAGGQIGAMARGQVIDHQRQAHLVLGPAPTFALEEHPQSGGAVNFSERPGLVVAVIPTQAGKDAQLLADFLLPVDAEAVADTIGPRRRDVRVDGLFAQADA